jgi:hypothetical protein
MTAVNPAASRQAVVETVLVLLERMGLTAADLAAGPRAGADLRRVRPRRVSGGQRRNPPGVRVVLEPGHRALGRPTPG